MAQVYDPETETYLTYSDPALDAGAPAYNTGSNRQNPYGALTPSWYVPGTGSEAQVSQYFANMGVTPSAVSRASGAAPQPYYQEGPMSSNDPYNLAYKAGERVGGVAPPGVPNVNPELQIAGSPVPGMRVQYSPSGTPYLVPADSPMWILNDQGLHDRMTQGMGGRVSATDAYALSRLTAELAFAMQYRGMSPQVAHGYLDAAISTLKPYSSPYLYQSQGGQIPEPSTPQEYAYARAGYDPRTGAGITGRRDLYPEYAPPPPPPPVVPPRAGSSGLRDVGEIFVDLTGGGRGETGNPNLPPHPNAATAPYPGMPAGFSVGGRGMGVSITPPSTGSGGLAAPQSYTIQPGDTLSSIAARYGTTVQAIAQANGIANPNLILAGQTITIPGGGGGDAPVGPNGRTAAEIRADALAGGTYISDEERAWYLEQIGKAPTSGGTSPVATTPGFQVPEGYVGPPTSNPARWTDWGEGVTYQGRVFGALGNHPYPGDAKAATMIPPYVEAYRPYVEKYFRPEDVTKALYVIAMEGGVDPRTGQPRYQINGPASGLFQIEGGDRHPGRPSREALLDPDLNAYWASKLVYRY